METATFGGSNMGKGGNPDFFGSQVKQLDCFTPQAHQLSDCLAPRSPRPFRSCLAHAAHGKSRFANQANRDLNF